MHACRPVSGLVASNAITPQGFVGPLEVGLKDLCSASPLQGSPAIMSMLANVWVSEVGGVRADAAKLQQHQCWTAFV